MSSPDYHNPNMQYWVTSPGSLNNPDGPFDTPEEAMQFLFRMCGDYTTPELLSQVVITSQSGVLDLYKIDGEVVDGHWLRDNPPGVEK